MLKLFLSKIVSNYDPLILIFIQFCAIVQLDYKIIIGDMYWSLDYKIDSQYYHQKKHGKYKYLHLISVSENAEIFSATPPPKKKPPTSQRLKPLKRFEGANRNIACIIHEAKGNSVSWPWVFDHSLCANMRLSIFSVFHYYSSAKQVGRELYSPNFIQVNSSVRAIVEKFQQNKQ